MKKFNSKKFGQLIKEKRSYLKLSQMEIARRLKYSRRTVSYYEKGAVLDPPHSKVMAFLEVLSIDNINLDKCMDDDE